MSFLVSFRSANYSVIPPCRNHSGAILSPFLFSLSHFLEVLLEVSFRLFSNTSAADSTKLQPVFTSLGILWAILFTVDLGNSRLKSSIYQNS